ncbi:MAG: NAD-dependent epimerase/dehydratase family protein, partial [Candidatus Staskawiczbacteria bacterium]|nr:NAD-dependent epimerase/dehydratase family protein [Candidatus Staskawiczbacteria bacterium]
MFDNKFLIEDWNDVISNIGMSKLNVFKNKTVLITGANGFIGRSLTHFFIYLNEKFSENIKLILVDKEFKNNHQNNVLTKKYDVKFLKLDLLKKLELDFDVDYVFHLAVIISHELNSKTPVDSLRVNILGTENILDAVKDKNIKKFIYFSSAGIYGSPDEKNIPTTESFNGNISPISPRSCYAEGKRAAEALSMAYYRQYNLPVNIVRPFHMYGPLMNFQGDNALNFFLNCGFNNKDIFLETTGEDTRSLCYITDVLSIILLVCLNKKSGEVFNVGNEEAEIKIIDLANLINKIFGNRIKVHIRKNNKGDFFKGPASRNVSSMAKVKNILKFTPKVDIEKGLK